MKPETFHHWKIFAGHPGGVCITFDSKLLLDNIKKISNVRVGKIKYKLIKELKEFPPSIEDLPFIKRKHYRDEDEFRIIYEGYTKEMSVKHFKIDLSIIKKITLSPWVPKAIAKSTKEMIWALPECEDINIIRTGVIENSQWKNFAKNLA